MTLTYKEKLLPGSLVSASILAKIMYDKFVLGLPLYRQEQDLLRNDIILTRQDMVNWITRFTMDLFGPIYPTFGTPYFKKGYFLFQ